MGEQQNDAAVAAAAKLGAVVGVLIFLVILLVPAIFYLLSLQKALNRVSPENRAMAPGLVWLMLIPLFNLVWHFFVVLNISKSLGAEFQKRGMNEDPAPGKTIGLVMCILACFCWIPFLNLLTDLGTLVCWIIYWVQIAGYSKKLAA